MVLRDNFYISMLACRCAQRMCALCVEVLVEFFYLLVGCGFAKQWSCFNPCRDVSA